MKKKHLFFAALFLAALVFGFVGCENPDSQSGISIEKPGDDSTSDKPNDSEDGDTKPTTPEALTLVATGGASDVEYSTVTLWGRINTDTLWAFPNIKWGIEYAYDYATVAEHKHQETTKVLCSTPLQGENVDEFSVEISGIEQRKIYYSAYILINDMKYIYGEVDSVHLDVKLTVNSNNSNYGTVTDCSGTYDYGTEVTITATPRYHDCMFVEWNDGNTDNPRTVIVNEDITYTATLTVNPIVPPTCTDYVDLGLSVKWATCNVGASSPEELGCYFAWGETTTKSTYNSSTYTYTSNPSTLPLSKDAAAVNMGGSWRMPTRAEQNELRTECTWTWTSNYNGTGVAGRIVTSKINGNSIFLPAAGYRGSSGLNDAGSYGHYWSSSLDTDNSYNACSLYFYSGHVYWNNGRRYYGLSVRGVCP